MSFPNLRGDDTHRVRNDDQSFGSGTSFSGSGSGFLSWSYLLKNSFKIENIKKIAQIRIF
jgi:hypothetical protein